MCRDVKDIYNVANSLPSKCGERVEAGIDLARTNLLQVHCSAKAGPTTGIMQHPLNFSTSEHHRGG